ncbi:MAG: TPM domain-containing protein [Rhodothermales bacterium]|nr:TPM domain-containing protein [Rhodothermales bacterium]
MTTYRLAGLVASLLLLVVLTASAQDLPALIGRVVDRAEVLSPSAERQLDDLLQAHEDSTGNQIAVLTIRSLDGMDLESYSLDVARAWQLGQADRDNGVLLLVALDDRKMRIEVGYGLEGDLPDITASRIIQNDIRPYFQRDDYEGGILAGARAIVSAVEGSYVATEGSDEMPLLFRLVFSAMFMGMPLAVSFASAFVPGWQRWFPILFLTPFIFAGSMVLTMAIRGAIVITLLYLVGHIALAIYFYQSPEWRAVMAKMKKAQKTGGKVRVEIFGRTFHVRAGSIGGGSSSSSSGGSSFSGGGGSFGGGGSSGSW